MNAGWWFLLPFPAALPLAVVLSVIAALGRLREWLCPPRETVWRYPERPAGPYVPRARLASPADDRWWPFEARELTP